MMCFFFTFNIIAAHKQMHNLEEFDTMFLHLNNVYYKRDHLIKTRLLVTQNSIYLTEFGHCCMST